MTTLRDLPNYASGQYGASVIHCSSEQPEYNASNVVDFQNANDLQFWVSESSLPQSLYIKIDKNQLRDQILLVGWYCHKRYIFNAKEVKFFVAKYYTPRGDDTHFVPWATLSAEQDIGYQLFKVRPIPKDYCYFKFEILDTFGGNRVYMNKLIALDTVPQVMPTTDDELIQQQTSGRQATKLFDDREVSLNEISRSPLVDVSTPDSATTQSKSTMSNSEEIFNSNRIKRELDQELESIKKEIDNNDALESEKQALRTEQLVDKMLRSREQPRSAVPVMQTTVTNTHELATKLAEMNQEITKLSHRSEQTINGTPTITQTQTPYIPLNELKTIEKGIQGCMAKTREILYNVQQLQERVHVLEESNVLPLINDQKNLAFELRKEVKEFKGKLYEKVATKVKKSIHKIEARMKSEMNQHIARLMEQQLTILQQDIAQQISLKLSQARLTHPQNVEIDEYNTKVKFINKKVVEWNQSYQYEDDVLNRRLLVQEKMYPNQLEDSAPVVAQKEEAIHNMNMNIARKQREFEEIHQSLKSK